jgi:nitrous oxide reductase accessory protein NosL
MMVFVLAGFSMVFAQDDIAEHPTCPLCGMDRAKFAHSRVLVTYDDGSYFGACSVHCAAIDMVVNIDKAPQTVMVGDFDTKQLIDAETAAWVVGGSKMGVMTKRAKWAFADEAAAKKFIQQNGGEEATFDEAMKATFEDMYQDTKMIRDKRKMMREKMKKQ